MCAIFGGEAPIARAVLAREASAEDARKVPPSHSPHGFRPLRRLAFVVAT